MNDVLDWLSTLPTVALYVALGFFAMVENFFPPLPADTVVAFGSFLAARGQGSVIGSFLSTWTGNMLGVAVMYYAGHRLGPTVIRKITRGDDEKARARMQHLYGRYGYAALFLSRFVPGVRAIVPPFAGAMHIPVVPALIGMGLASAIWYGLITWLAFSVGENWSAFEARFATVGRSAAIVAGVLLLIGGVVWYVRRRRRA